MHIVLINPEHPSPSGNDHGGIATYTYCMANALAAEHHTVSILARRGTIPDTLNTAVRFYTVDPLPDRPIKQFRDRFRHSPLVHEEGVSRAMEQKVGEINRRQTVDIVEIPEYSGLAWAFIRVRNRNRYRIVIHFHTPSALVDQLNNVIVSKFHRQIHAFEFRALKNAHAYKSPSRAMINEATRLFSIPAESITLVPHPLALELFSRIVRTDNLGGHYQILFVGRLECRKGAELLLQSIDSILNLDPRIQISFAGETLIGNALNYRDAIERSLSETSRGRIWFLGPISRGRLPLLYSRSSLLIIPSLFENAPYTLFEAMAAQLPVVASDGGGMGEIISHGSNGLLFKRGDANSFIACIKEALRDPAAAKKRAGQALCDLGSRHNPHTVALNAIAHYQSIAQKQPPCA